MLRPLTSLRFFAALLVFFWHAQWTAAFAQEHIFGPAGVEFFFVLSGFILTYAYRGAFAQTLALRTMRDFWVARFARIYPLHALTLAAAIVIGFSGRAPYAIPPRGFWPILGAHIALLQTWDLPDMVAAFRFNDVAWTISDEAFFYAVFPLVAWAALRAGRPVSSVLLYVAAAPLIEALVTMTLPASIDGRTLYVFPPIRLFDFVGGVLLATAFTGGLRGPRGRPATALEAATIAAFAAALWAAPQVKSTLVIGPYFFPFSALIIGTFAYAAGSIARVLSTRVMVYLGEVSFAIYMIHAIILKLVPSSSPLECVLALAATIALAAAIHEVFERPLRERIRARLAAHEPGPRGRRQRSRRNPLSCPPPDST